MMPTLTGLHLLSFRCQISDTSQDSTLAESRKTRNEGKDGIMGMKRGINNHATKFMRQTWKSELGNKMLKGEKPSGKRHFHSRAVVKKILAGTGSKGKKGKETSLGSQDMPEQIEREKSSTQECWIGVPAYWKDNSSAWSGTKLNLDEARNNTPRTSFVMYLMFPGLHGGSVCRHLQVKQVAHFEIFNVDNKCSLSVHEFCPTEA